MNGDKIFIDTNILVHGHDVDAGQKHQIARSTLVELWEQRTRVMSVQVLQEFYVTMTRKVLRPLPPNKVSKYHPRLFQLAYRNERSPFGFGCFSN